MEMKRMKTKHILSAALALLLVASLPVTAFAADWYLEDGDITVSADSSGQTVTQGSAAVEDAAPVITQRDSTAATTNTVTITAAENQTADVTLKDVNIDVSGTGSVEDVGSGSAAVSTGGAGNVTIELEGENTVKSGLYRAGMEKNNDGSLTITDADSNGSLNATGGSGGGAGIGGGYGGSGSNIILSDSDVNATGGSGGAGIGGGYGGSGSDITISGGTTKATGGNLGAGIGGGCRDIDVDVFSGNGSNIILSDSDVTAEGGVYGAGIGGGYGGSGSEITISGGTTNATGSDGGAGIGGGTNGSGSEITISGSMTNATGGLFGAGIGGGANGSGSEITISGGTTNAAGGYGGAGIGGGAAGSGSDITVSGDAQVKVQGGHKVGGCGTGAPIGNGGTWDDAYNPIGGEEVAPDVSELTPAGKIEYYAPGADMEKDAPIEDKTVTGKHEHQWVAGEVTKEPTCTETGVRIDTCISDETNSFTRTVELPLREHEFKDYFPDGNASCENDGTKTAKCVWYDQCGKEDTLPNEGGRLPHTVVMDEAVAPTYTHTGLTEGSHCSVCHETIVAQEIVPMLEKSAEAPLYRVKDADGRGVNYKAERKDGVLTITVDADFAVLTGTLYGINTLKTQGVEKIVFVTKSAKSTFALADLLEKGSRGETYKLTHDGKTVTFTLGAKNTDVSDILEKA